MNIERMLAVADAVEKHTEPLQFDMRYFSQPTSCGTAACIAGHAIHMFPTPPVPSEDEGMLARRILDLTIYQSDRLFFNDENYIDKVPHGALSPITRQQAAAAIRRMVEEEG